MSVQSAKAQAIVLILWMVISLQQVAPCPATCECSSSYYVYCQASGLQDFQLVALLSRVPASAILLDLSSNYLTQIPSGAFRSLPNLEHLNLASNGITEIQDEAFGGLIRLRELILRRNKIAAMKPESFTGLASLKELHLGDNQIDSVPSQMFRNLTTLEKLQLQKNSIQAIAPSAFLGLSSLVVLNVSHNNLKSLAGLAFRGLRSLKKLWLSDNLINEFVPESFSGLPSLDELRLDRNNISDLLFMFGNNFSSSLTSVTLSRNRISSVLSHVFPHNKMLKHIDLSFNTIRHIGGQALGGLYLESLSLEGNNLSLINREIFRNVKRISNLYLSKNRIEDIQTGAFDSFRETLLALDMRSNQLTEVHPGMFRGMRRLRVFNLATNNISVLDPGALSDMRELQELRLSGNMFSVLTSEMISGPLGLKRLFLVCNPLRRFTGFALDRVDDRILIELNSTILDSTPTTAVIAWPYAEGTHLYWTLSVQCVSSFSCIVPEYESTLKPYVTEVTITGLIPGAEYFICVNPVFLSPDAHVSQCVSVRTEYVNTNGESTGSASEMKALNSSSSSSYIFPPPAFMLLVFISFYLTLDRATGKFFCCS